MTRKRLHMGRNCLSHKQGWGDMTTSVGHIQPRRHLDKLEGRLVYWRMFQHPMLHRLPSTLGDPGFGNLFLPTHFFTSSSGSISWGCSWFLSSSPQKAEKREPREGEIASSNCSGAGLVVKTCQSHQVCLTGPPLQRLTWLQGTEATGQESVNLCCPWMAVPWACAWTCIRREASWHLWRLMQYTCEISPKGN